MNTEQLLYRALLRIMEVDGIGAAIEIAQAAIAEYSLRQSGQSFQDFRGSDFLKLIVQSDLRSNMSRQALKDLWLNWVQAVPCHPDRKPPMTTTKNVADWFLSSYVWSQDRSGCHYKTRVFALYEYAQKMTTPEGDWIFESCTDSQD